MKLLIAVVFRVYTFLKNFVNFFGFIYPFTGVMGYIIRAAIVEEIHYYSLAQHASDQEAFYIGNFVWLHR